MSSSSSEEFSLENVLVKGNFSKTQLSSFKSFFQAEINQLLIKQQPYLDLIELLSDKYEEKKFLNGKNSTTFAPIKGTSPGMFFATAKIESLDKIIIHLGDNWYVQKSKKGALSLCRTMLSNLSEKISLTRTKIKYIDSLLNGNPIPKTIINDKINKPKSVPTLMGDKLSTSKSTSKNLENIHVLDNSNQMEDNFETYNDFDESFPITEIIEQLDDDGNVIDAQTRPHRLNDLKAISSIIAKKFANERNNENKDASNSEKTNKIEDITDIKETKNTFSHVKSKPVKETTKSASNSTNSAESIVKNVAEKTQTQSSNIKLSTKDNISFNEQKNNLKETSSSSSKKTILATSSSSSIVPNTENELNKNEMLDLEKLANSALQFDIDELDEGYEDEGSGEWEFAYDDDNYYTEEDEDAEEDEDEFGRTRGSLFPFKLNPNFLQANMNIDPGSCTNIKLNDTQSTKCSTNGILKKHLDLISKASHQTETEASGYETNDTDSGKHVRFSEKIEVKLFSSQKNNQQKKGAFFNNNKKAPSPPSLLKSSKRTSRFKANRINNKHKKSRSDSLSSSSSSNSDSTFLTQNTNRKVESASFQAANKPKIYVDPSLETGKTSNFESQILTLDGKPVTSIAPNNNHLNKSNLPDKSNKSKLDDDDSPFVLGEVIEHVPTFSSPGSTEDDMSPSNEAFSPINDIDNVLISSLDDVDSVIISSQNEIDEDDTIYDEEVHRREISQAYHKLRQKFIMREKPYSARAREDEEFIMRDDEDFSSSDLVNDINNNGDENDNDTVFVTKKSTTRKMSLFRKSKLGDRN